MTGNLYDTYCLKLFSVTNTYISCHSLLAMSCCGLALVLIRRVSDASNKILITATKGSKRKASSLDLQQNEDKADEEDGVKESGDKEAAAVPQSRIENIKEQINALLSFKEALCSGKHVQILLLICL